MREQFRALFATSLYVFIAIIYTVIFPDLWNQDIFKVGPFLFAVVGFWGFFTIQLFAPKKPLNSFELLAFKSLSVSSGFLVISFISANPLNESKPIDFPSSRFYTFIGLSAASILIALLFFYKRRIFFWMTLVKEYLSSWGTRSLSLSRFSSHKTLLINNTILNENIQKSQKLLKTELIGRLGNLSRHEVEILTGRKTRRISEFLGESEGKIKPVDINKGTFLYDPLDIKLLAYERNWPLHTSKVIRYRINLLEKTEKKSFEGPPRSELPENFRKDGDTAEKVLLYIGRKLKGHADSDDIEDAAIAGLVSYWNSHHKYPDKEETYHLISAINGAKDFLRTLNKQHFERLQEDKDYSHLDRSKTNIPPPNGNDPDNL